MADKKLPDLAYDGLGDITAITHNQGVSDLSWLAVDEADYRAAEALPKQNLDTIPELSHALAVEDDVPHLIPLRPHTIVNRNPLENSGQTSPVDMTAPIRNRVARMVMAGLPLAEIEKKVRLEFAPGDIRIAGEAIKSLLSERGLLGNVYIDASHFPRAAHDPKERKLARTLGKSAVFVIGGCGGCGGCDSSLSNSGSQTGICVTFGGKRVVDEVPYSSKLAAIYAPRLAAEKRPMDALVPGPGEPAVSRDEWKERIRAAFLKSPIHGSPDGVKTAWTQPVPARPKPVTAADVEAFWQRRFSTPRDPGMPSVAYMKYARRMMQGHDDSAILAASGDPELGRLASQAGIIGHTYVDVDALGGCRNALDLVRTRSAASGGLTPFVPDFFVRRSSSCPHCKDAKDGACAQLCKVSALAHDVPEVGRTELIAALQRAVLQRRVSPDQAKSALEKTASGGTNYRFLTAQVNLYQPPKPGAAYSGHRQTAHNGRPGSDSSKAAMDPEEVRRTISHLMNSGLSGRPLQAAILQRYSRDDLSQVPEVGRRASMDDGVQGHYFVDPTAYRDYGRGCDDGAKSFRKRGAPYVLASSGCTGCTLQTAPGWCSKYSKAMIRQVPTSVRERVASARRHLPVRSDPVENPVEKYELAGEMAVDLSGSRSRAVAVEISSPSLDK